MSRVVQAFLLSGVIVLAASAPASAALIFTVQEVGGNVELTMSGSINLDATISGLGPGGGGGFLIMEPADGVIRVGSGPNYFREISNILSSEWTPFGSGAESFSGMTAGDRVELAGDGNLGLPDGYVSGAPLSATGTFVGATFASLGMTPGSYLSIFSSSSSGQLVSDSVTVNINAASVPEPATLSLLGLGLGVAAVRRRVKRR